MDKIRRCEGWGAPCGHCGLEHGVMVLTGDQLGKLIQLEKDTLEGTVMEVEGVRFTLAALMQTAGAHPYPEGSAMFVPLHSIERFELSDVAPLPMSYGDVLAAEMDRRLDSLRQAVALDMEQFWTGDLGLPYEGPTPVLDKLISSVADPNRKQKRKAQKRARRKNRRK